MYITQTVENQEVMWLPTNSDTKTIHYDTKFLKSETGRMPPLAYKVSKIEDTAVRGITKFTMTQEQYSGTLDNFEEMIGGYYSSTASPEVPEKEEVPTTPSFKISYSGSPAVRAGGGYKKFILKSIIDDEQTDYAGDVEWSVDFPGGDSDKLETSVEGNVFRVKCKPDYSLIGKTFTITAQVEHSSKSLIVEITSL